MRRLALERAKAFLPVLKAANVDLLAQAKQDPRRYDLEDVSQDTEVVEMVSMLQLVPLTPSTNAISRTSVWGSSIFTDNPPVTLGLRYISPRSVNAGIPILGMTPLTYQTTRTTSPRRQSRRQALQMIRRMPQRPQPTRARVLRVTRRARMAPLPPTELMSGRKWGLGLILALICMTM